VLDYRHGQRTNEEFWQNAGSQLLQNLFDVFLFAQAPLSLDRRSSLTTPWANIFTRSEPDS